MALRLPPEPGDDRRPTPTAATTSSQTIYRRSAGALDPDGNRYRVLDVHQHLGEDTESDTEDAAARQQFMDRFDVEAACIMPSTTGLGGADADEVNERVAAYCRLAPQRFTCGIGLVQLAAPAHHVQHQVRHLVDLGLKGVVWHHMFLGEFLDSPATMRAMEVCRTEGLCVYVHVIASSIMEALWRLGRLAERFPDLTIVALDGLSSPHQGQAMIELARTHHNVVVDTAVLASYGNLIERFVDVNGDDRVVFGSDYSVHPKPFAFPYSLSEILYSDLSVESKAKILSGNALRITRLSADRRHAVAQVKASSDADRL